MNTPVPNGTAQPDARPLAERLKARVAAAHAQVRHTQVEVEAAMHSRLAAEDDMRQRLLPLHRDIVRPAVEALGAAFDAATITHTGMPRGFVSQCKLGRSRGFAAAARFTVGVEWGERGGAWVLARRDVIPKLGSFEGSERLPISTSEPDHDAVRAWLEERVLTFANACLSIAADEFYRGGMVRMDPVCGMEVWMEDASALLEYEGRSYAFCSAVCRTRFEASPQTYAAAATPQL